MTIQQKPTNVSHAARRNNNGAKRPTGRSNYNPRQPRFVLDELVIEALDFINKHADNSKVYKCFHKANGMLKTFGVYNSVTKVHSIHHTTNFYPEDLIDIKLTTLDERTYQKK